MQNIEQFVRERQEIKLLQTCKSYFLTFPKKICGVSVIRIPLQKTVQVDTRFYQETDDICIHIHMNRYMYITCIYTCICTCIMINIKLIFSIRKYCELANYDARGIMGEVH